MKKIKKTILSILILGPALLAFAQRSDLQEDYATERKGNQPQAPQQHHICGQKKGQAAEEARKMGGHGEGAAQICAEQKICTREKA